MTALFTTGQQDRLQSPSVRRPAYRRLSSDDRRRQLLDRAVELFAEHGYDELSMAAFARAAGISKPLLYHYFPSKRQLFEAALAQAAEEHLARVDTDPDAPPAEQLAAGLDAYLSWIEANPQAYVKLMRSAGIPEVRDLIDRVREDTAQRILTGLGDERPVVRAAVRGWLWSMDGVCLDWVTEGDLDRAQVRALLLGTLAGALQPAAVS
jgi:AcrR family transcriptional regulator